MSKPKKIVLYDQNEFFAHFRDMITRVAKQLGHEIDVVSGEKELREVASSDSIDMYIVDASSEDVIKSLDGNKPKIAISDIDDVSVRKEVGAAGFNEILGRYYSSEEIRFVLSNCINQDLVSKRKHPRILAGFPGLITLGNDSINGTVVNIGEGGAFLKTFTPTGEGSKVTLEFELGGEDGISVDDNIVCECQVVYVTPYHGSSNVYAPGLGLSFKNLSEEDRKLLREYINKRIIVKK